MRTKAKRMDAIKDALGKGVSGIINVVSYGYHEYDVDMGAAFNSDGSVNADFLEAHRSAEKRALREWTAMLGDRKTTGWLITIVNKADLWQTSGGTKRMRSLTTTNRDLIVRRLAMQRASVQLCCHIAQSVTGFLTRAGCQGASMIQIGIG
ncbi:MAG: hypothetical protein JW759_07755 [Candidatus Coatesbacteria bacterium]|nr:hypothetical protein [Candidatus Coatesbacteria bacterium]